MLAISGESCHDGYLKEEETIKVIAEINSLQPHLLLVGMGNPLQEYWLAKNRNQLKVPVCVGVGGLFDHWGGNLKRAPLWVRRLGFEWLQILLQQPGKKWQRYLIGNPKFLLQMILCRD
ncbi:MULTISPECIES: WecB/TagA/CpsF family glycosyltransferase [unclassified Anabaena]|uniref:WecB/TagA/CpsF family glycosyltransferase n=1 Tax=unclassified Anabaena TaxID=2619674 RepID=UPI0039C62359